MGQQQSVPDNVRPYEHCLPGSTLESNSKYFVPSQPVTKRSSCNKRSSVYSPLEERTFNLSIPKPPPNLNKELPTIQHQNQKRSSNFRSRIRSLKAHVLTEETDGLRNATHLMSRSDFSGQLDSDQRKFECNKSTMPLKDYRKNNLWLQRTSSNTENDFFYQNDTCRISINKRPYELAPERQRQKANVMKPLKTDSETRNSTTLDRNSSKRHNITSKLMLKSRAEVRKSSPTSCRHHRASLLSNAKKDQNEVFQKTNNYQYNVKDSFQPQRTVTPNDLDYRHIGAFKLGTLRITNGVASPAPSIEQGMKIEKRPQSHDKSTPQDSNPYNQPVSLQGPRARPWTIGWSSLLRNNRDYDLATPEIPSLSLISDTEGTSSCRLNIPEERMLPLVSDLEHVQNFDDPFTQSMISPYSLVESVEPSPPPQRTKIELSVRDSLFDEEPWTPSMIYHPSPNSQDRTPQILGEDREYLTLTKPLAKADSGYRSNISVRSKKINSEEIPDGDEEFRTSRSNSGAFSFVPSINLKEDQSNQKTDEFLVDSENVHSLNSTKDGNPSQKDCKSDMSEDESALIQKDDETISNTPISYTTQPSSIEPASTPSLSNSPTHSEKNTTPNSPTFMLSPQLIPSPLFIESRKESSDRFSRRYLQNNSSVEEFCQIKKNKDSNSLNIASKALLVPNSDQRPHSHDETAKHPSSLKENFQNLDKTIKYNTLAPLELPIEIMKGNSPSISSRAIHHEDVEAMIQSKEVESIKNPTLKESDQTATKSFIKSSAPADDTPKYRLNLTHKIQEQQLEESSLRCVDLPLLLDSKENSSNDLGNENVQLSHSHDKSSIFPDLIEKNKSEQFSLSQNQNPTPPIPRRSDLRASRNNSIIFSEESKSQHKLTSNLEDVSVAIRDKVCFSTDILDNHHVLSTTRYESEDLKQNNFHHVAYRLGKYKQIGPRPVIVPTIVANFQAIEQNTQKTNSIIKSSGKISQQSTASRNDLPYKKNKSIENIKACLPLGLVMGCDKSKLEKISGPESTKESQSTRLLRQRKSSQSVSTEIQFPTIAKDGFEFKESLESDDSPKLVENNRPKRYRRSSSALTVETPRAASVLQTRSSFEVHALENKSAQPETGRFHCLKEGVSRLITSIPGSMTSSNETITKSELANEKSQKLQRQDWTYKSSNTYTRSQSIESLDRHMTRNLDRNSFSNMSYNSRSNSKKGSSNSLRHNETRANLTQKKTSSPPCRNQRSHPPQAHVTRRSYTMFNQEPPKPNITNFYTYIENSQKQNLEMQEFESTTQLPPVVKGKMPHQKRKTSLSGKFERKFGSTGYTQSKMLDNKIIKDEENLQKTGIASEKNSSSPLLSQNSQDFKSDSSNINFINCDKTTHEVRDTICKKQEQPDKLIEEILVDKWHDDRSSRIENINSQIDKPQMESVLNRGRPISRAAETAILSKRSDAHVAIKLNSIKNNTNQENSNTSYSKTLEKDEILAYVQVPSYSNQKKGPLTNTTPMNLNLSKDAPDKRRNSYSSSEINSSSTIENSIDTLPSQKRARNYTLSVQMPSQRSTRQKSHFNTHLSQNRDVDYSFLENSHTEISLKNENSNETSRSQLSKLSISKKRKDSTNIETLALDGLFDKASQSIYTHSLLSDATDSSTASAFKTPTESYFVETKNKKFSCEDSLLKKDQDASMNTISSLDSLPSQCKDSKLRNSKNFLCLSHSTNKGTASEDKIPEIEYSQTQHLGSRGLRKLNTIESREDDQNHIQILPGSPVCEDNTSFSKNFPSIPKSIISFHNPSSLLPTDSYLSSSRRAKMLNVIDSDEVIMPPYPYMSPLSSISSEEDDNILVLSAGWRKDTIFTTQNGTTYT